MQNVKKINWGILGLGNIAHKFAEDLILVDDAKIISVASSSIDRAKIFSKKFKVKNSYDSYQKLINDKEIDVIYIASINTLHMKWTIKSLEKGKAVLCEKPLAMNPVDVKKMIATSVKNNVFLMEALWSRFNPSISKVKELIDNGSIGEVKYIYSEFSFLLEKMNKKHRLLDPKKGPGSLVDIGIYPIFLSYLLLGKPKDVVAKAHYFNNKADIQISMIFHYPNAQSVMYSGITNNSDNGAKICGAKGEIYLNPRWHETDSFKLVNEMEQEIFEIPKKGRGYTHEIEEVNNCLKKNKIESTLWSHNNSYELSQLINQIRISSKE